MVSSGFYAASCCLLIGGAGLRVHSFAAPGPPAARGRHRGRRGGATAAIPAHSVKSRESDSGVVDDFWADLSSSIATKTDAGSQDAIRAEYGSQEMADRGSPDATKWILAGGTLTVLAAAGALAVTMGNDLGIDLELGQLIKDPSNSFYKIVESLGAMDLQKGMVYFSAFYILAEILAIPAVPILTASAGYLFGTLPGTATCLFSAVVAASVSFVIGKTILRGYVEEVLEEFPKFRSFDRAIGDEGFKLMLLLRLSPLFPFALSNYLYGASSIRFPAYILGTLFGFAPGTFAYVYAGTIGKALTTVEKTSEPWYVYAGGLAAILALLKVAGDVAASVIDAMDEGGADAA